MNPNLAWSDLPDVTLPCGQCLGCRKDHAQHWAVRCLHEGQMHECSSFVTLTFDDENLPWDCSISTRDLQTFMKRIRKAFGPGVRFFACGEYGETNWRPHYHLILFGIDFAEDRYPWRMSPSGHQLYRSPKLEKLWPFGHSEIGDVTKDSVEYVARYVFKKVTGESALSHYERVHPLTGEICRVKPEFVVMSRRPGIGATWYDRFSSDVFPSDFVIVDGSKATIPRFYSKKLKAAAEQSKAANNMHHKVRAERVKRGRRHAENNTPERLAVREEVARLKIERKVRDL